MNIGMVVDNEFFGDPRVMNEARLLNDAGHKVYVLCFDFGNYSKKNTFKGVQLVKISIPRKIKNLLFFMGNLIPLYYRMWAANIRKFVSEHDIEVIHLHDLYMLKAGIRVKSKLDIPMIVDLHENYPEVIKSYRWANKFPNRLFTMPWKWKKFEDQHLEEVDKIVVLSNNFKKQLLEEHPELNAGDIVRYPNVPDVDVMLSYPINRSVLERKDDETILFYFGGISERRGILTTLNALKILVMQKFNVRLLLIGPIDKAEQEKFSKRMAEMQIAGRIIYIPWIDISEFPSYVVQSDICLSPIFKNAHHESGVANKVFQYMLFEKPVVVSNNKPQVEVVEDDQCGLVFKSKNATDLAEKIALLIKNPEKQKRMGENGKRAVLNKYNTKAMGKALKGVYEDFQD